VKAFERLAHGDHNPRHGGQFFMADDNWHHIEGTHPSRDTFRVFLYDDYTRPIAPTGFSGKVIVLDDANREVTSVPLRRGRVARTLEARIPSSAATRVKLMLRFPDADRDRVFDFVFSDITREPVQTTTAAPSNAPQATRSTAPAPPAPQPAVPAAGSSPAVVSAPSAPPLATFLAGSPLPDTTEGLVDELNRADQELRAVIERGEFAVAWVSAMRAKDAALALEEKTAGSNASRPEVAQALKQLVLAAWEIDAVGDLGDKDKIVQAYAAFSAAASTIAGAHQPR
jgi:hypothetical protein